MWVLCKGTMQETRFRPLLYIQSDHGSMFFSRPLCSCFDRLRSIVRFGGRDPPTGCWHTYHFPVDTRFARFCLFIQSCLSRAGCVAEPTHTRVSHASFWSSEHIRDTCCNFLTSVPCGKSSKMYDDRNLPPLQELKHDNIFFGIRHVQVQFPSRSGIYRNSCFLPPTGMLQFRHIA